MSHLKKRGRTAICSDNDGATTSNNFKKAKMDDKGMKSMFNHIGDHMEFIKCLKIIDSSKLIRDLSIPLDISKEIAELSTGRIQTCSKEGCNGGICILKEDIEKFNNKQINDFDKWNYCKVKDKYFCHLCAPFTIRFICCHTIQCVKDYKKCRWNREIQACCDHDYMGFKCCYCDTDQAVCEICGEWMCVYHDEDDRCAAGIHRLCCAMITVMNVQNAENRIVIYVIWISM